MVKKKSRHPLTSTTPARSEVLPQEEPPDPMESVVLAIMVNHIPAIAAKWWYTIAQPLQEVLVDHLFSHCCSHSQPNAQPLLVNLVWPIPVQIDIFSSF